MRKYTPEEVQAKHDELVAYLEMCGERATVKSVTKRGHLGALHRAYGNLNTAKKALGIAPRIGKGYKKDFEFSDSRPYWENETLTQEELFRFAGIR